MQAGPADPQSSSDQAPVAICGEDEDRRHAPVIDASRSSLAFFSDMFIPPPTGCFRASEGALMPASCIGRRRASVRFWRSRSRGSSDRRPAAWLPCSSRRRRVFQFQKRLTPLGLAIEVAVSGEDDKGSPADLPRHLVRPSRRRRPRLPSWPASHSVCWSPHRTQSKSRAAPAPVSKIVPEHPNTVFTPLTLVSTRDDRCLRICALKSCFPLLPWIRTGGTTWLPSATFSTNMK